MRIALVSQEYPPETAKGGLGTQTYLKAHGLATRGHEVHVISHTGGRMKPGEYMDGNVRVWRIAGFYDRLFIREPAVEWLTYSAEVAAALERLQQRHAVDLIDFAEWGGEGYLHLLNRTPENFVPAVLQLHGPLVMFAQALGWPALDSEFYRVGLEMEKTCFRLADAVYSSSECSARWCRQHYHPRPDPIPVIHTGVDTELFAPRDIPKATRATIVFVGRIVPNKGLRILLEACCALAAEVPDLHVQVIGSAQPDMINELEATARAFPGLLQRSEPLAPPALAEALARAHVFAAPSIYEGGPGFVYLEAMATGLPTIGCSGSGLDEIIESGSNGILVPPNDVAALVGALRSLITNPAEREAMGKRARQYILTHARREDCLDRLEAFYQDVLARAPGRSSQ